MPPKKKKDNTIKVKKFKQLDNDWWVQFLHYSIIRGKLTVCAGGKETEEHKSKIAAYLKRNKIKYES